MLCFLPYPAAVLEKAQLAQNMNASRAPEFWKGLSTQGAGEWPTIKQATVRIGRVLGGVVFTVEDAQGLLVMGAAGLGYESQAWAALNQAVRELREETISAVQQAPGGAQVLASWQVAPALPATGPWMMLVPMIGMRYYAPDAERILTLTAALGLDLLTITTLA